MPTPVTPDTNKLKPYTPAGFPLIPGGEAKFISDELRKLRTSLQSVIAVLEAHETRLASGSL